MAIGMGAILEPSGHHDRQAAAPLLLGIIPTAQA